MTYEKLVRDRIPDIIIEDKGTPITRHVSSLEEYERVLSEKLWEEVDEFLEAHDAAHRTREAADVLEVLFAFFKLKNIAKEEVMEKVGQHTERLVVGISELRVRLFDEVDALLKTESAEQFAEGSVKVIRSVRTIMQRYEIELDAILAMQRTLRDARGGFEKGIMLTMESA